MGGELNKHSDIYNNKAQVYDIATNQWLTLNLKFESRAYHNVHLYDHKLYILGGVSLANNVKLIRLNNKIEVYDLQTNTLFSSKTNHHLALDCTSSLFNNKLFVAGGAIKQYEERKVFSDKIHLLDLKTGYWYDVGSIPKLKDSRTILNDSTIYFIRAEKFSEYIHIDRYEIPTGNYYAELKAPIELALPQIINRGELIIPRVAYANGVIYLYNPHQFNGEIRTYNIHTKEMYSYKIDLSLYCSELLYHQGKLYLVGGYTEEDEGNTEISNKLYSIDLQELDRTKAHYVPNVLDISKQEN